jgi:hypothetical protein
MTDPNLELKVIKVLSETLRKLLIASKMRYDLKDSNVSMLFHNLEQNSLVLETEIDRRINGHGLTPEFAGLIVGYASSVIHLKAQLLEVFPDLRFFNVEELTDAPENIEQIAYCVVRASETIYSSVKEKLRKEAELSGDLFTRLFLSGKIQMNGPMTIH